MGLPLGYWKSYFSKISKSVLHPFLVKNCLKKLPQDSIRSELYLLIEGTLEWLFANFEQIRV